MLRPAFFQLFCKFPTCLCAFIALFFLSSVCAENITGFQELQLCEKKTDIQDNLKDNKEGKAKRQYRVSAILNNFPFDGLHVDYFRPDQEEKGKIIAICVFFGKSEALYRVSILWEHIDDEKAEEYYFSMISAQSIAEERAKELAIGLGKKYGLKFRSDGNEYQLMDEKTNNMLVIGVLPAGEELRWIFGSDAEKNGYFVLVMYVNIPLFNAAQLAEKMEEEREAEKKAIDSGL